MNWLSLKRIGFLLMGLVIVSSSQAQVYLRLVLEPDQRTYTVYMRSGTAYSGRMALMSTSQVTITVPHGTGPNRFEVTDLTSPIANMHWGQQDRVDAPEENPAADYLFFSFINNRNPLVQFDIKKNEDIVLFRFKRKGECIGKAELLDNQQDLFRTPNSKGINVGNSVSLLATAGNAYQGNLDTLPQIHIRVQELICAEQPVEMTVQGASAISGASYQWFVNDKPLGAPSSQPGFLYHFSTDLAGSMVTIRLRTTIAGSSSCDDRILTSVEKRLVKKTPAAHIDYTGTTCTDLPVNLQVASQTNAGYQWLMNGDTISNATQPSYTVTKTGQYTVQVSLNGCIQTSPNLSLIGVSANDRIELTPPMGQTVVAGEGVVLHPVVVNATSYQWQPADGLTSTTIANPTANPSATTTYTLTVSNASGCQVTDTVRIVLVPALYMPTAFSPNHDGVNDSWLIRNLEHHQPSQVLIANRWGRVVYSPDDYTSFPWNVSNYGQDIEAGLYYYTIRTPYASYAGSVVVVR